MIVFFNEFVRHYLLINKINVVSTILYLDVIKVLPKIR